MFVSLAIATIMSGAEAAAQGLSAQGKIVALQGHVEHAPAARHDAWGPASLLQPLFVDDRVRTQPLSRAAILFIDETQVRLNAGAVLTVQAVKRGSGAPTALDLVRGEGWFRTKNPSSGLTIKTPAATAAIRGTEINLQIGADGESVLTVVEGAAAFTNEAGSVLATAGEEARARTGQAPTKRTLLNPDNAVQWALYYPVRQARADVPAAALASPARPAFERLRVGDAAGALSIVATRQDPWSRIAAVQAYIERGDLDAARQTLERLDGLGPAAQPSPAAQTGPNRDAVQGALDLAVARHAEAAALALVQGQAPQARTEIEAALTIDPEALRPLLLLATLELTLNHQDAAAQAVARARARHPQSVGALVAASEIAQARFDLPEAQRLVDRALAIDPHDVRALVNRARLRFGTGDTNGAAVDAAEATRIAPSDAGALSLRGFVELAKGHDEAAARSFTQAVAADREMGEPHLGLGLVAFQQRRIDSGLEEMLTATLLEPKVSLYQSYLGKSYYQLRRFREGLAALESAKRLDPRDPTPWLYASLFLRDQNRQVAALDALRESIARNGNRAVYRSRLLLDRDEATRNVSLAELYRQLGFEAWGAFEATKSLEADLTNASAHLFLAETYGNLPDRTQALGSALLQYFLYSPVNRNTFNNFSEYTALLDQPFRQISLIPSFGSDGWSSGSFVTRSGNERFAHYAFIEHQRQDGARPDDPDYRTQGFAQAKVSLTERDSLFASYLDVTTDDGEGPDVVRLFGLGTLTPIALRQFSSNLDPNLTTRIRDQQGVLGYEHEWRPGSALTATVDVEHLVSRDTNPDEDVSACLGIPLDQFGALSSTRVEYPFERLTFQGQQATRLGRHQVIGGTLLFRQRKERRCNEHLYSATETLDLDDVFRQRDHHYRGYVRDEIELTSRLHATLGVTYDDVRFGAPTTANRVDTLSEWSPQAGISVRLTPQTLLRAAAFRSVAGDPLGSRISPITLSGFVVDRNELPTTVRDEFGVSLDRAFRRVFVSGTWFVRDTDVQAAKTEGLISPEADVTTRGASGYVNWILNKRWSLFADEQYQRASTALYLREDQVVRAGLNFIYERGLFARVSGGYYRQRFLDAAVADLPRSNHLLVDVDVNYEFAAKRGLLTFRVTNLFDRGFSSVLEGVSVQRLWPDRRAYLTLRWRL